MLANFKLLFLVILVKVNIIHGSNNRKISDVSNKRDNGARVSSYPKFLQFKIFLNNNNEKVTPDVDEKKDVNFFNLLFHPPVQKRFMDVGLEDSNEGVRRAIDVNEEEDRINRLMDHIEENEQSQVESFYNSFDIQNAQLKEISKLF